MKDIRSDGTFPEGACDQPATQLVCAVEGGSAHPLCDAHADEARRWRHMLAWFRGDRPYSALYPPVPGGEVPDDPAR